MIFNINPVLEFYHLYTKNFVFITTLTITRLHAIFWKINFCNTCQYKDKISFSLSILQKKLQPHILVRLAKPLSSLVLVDVIVCAKKWIYNLPHTSIYTHNHLWRWNDHYTIGTICGRTYVPCELRPVNQLRANNVRE